MLIRLDLCGILPALSGLGELHIVPDVHDEFAAGGPERKAVLRSLPFKRHRIVPGTAEWEALTQVRGPRFSTTDLGEDASLATCLVEADRGKLLPLVTCDRGAATKAQGFGIISLDFLTTLAWLVQCGKLSFAEANHAEQAASRRNGWRPPPGYSGALENHAESYRRNTIEAIENWHARAVPKSLS